MAKLGVVIDEWMREKELSATAIQCWTAIEEFYGVVPCTIMSMMSESLLPSACETDVAGLLGMYVLQAASGQPAALLDWNNNFGTNPDKGVVFHCSNLPASFFSTQKMDYQEIIAGSVGKENTYGHPAPSTIAALRAAVPTVLRTDRDGTTRLHAAAGRIWIEDR